MDICTQGRLCSLKSCKWAFAILLLAALLIVIHFVHMKLTKKDVIKDDFMNQGVFTVNGNTWSWWPISHFILYFILGFFFPQCFLLLMVIGVAFEMLETFVGYLTRKKNDSGAKAAGVEYSENWWAGSVRDIFVNALGFIAGAAFGFLYRATLGRKEI